MCTTLISWGSRLGAKGQGGEEAQPCSRRHPGSWWRKGLGRCLPQEARDWSGWWEELGVCRCYVPSQM